ncbi:unnamed protein product [Didymodactylos carnosus]|uniref:Uncharacterized protein n=1 Tax=Didymodactylos carnosus TaxID=1234261 RepID=A0A815U1T7_9BILA|nr:unnamed protein product [Didymodactylos carnosus]CAF4371203.1 unnamed protein product [Didymodactylos carnosus]
MTRSRESMQVSEKANHNAGRNSDVIKSKASSLILKTKRLTEELTDKVSGNAEQLSEKFLSLKVHEQYASINGLIQLFSHSDYVDQVQLLTLCPSEWGRVRVETFFNATEAQARSAIELRSTTGILARPDYNRGNKPLESATVTAVIDFYSSDAVSRQSPNKKDTLLVKLGDTQEKRPVPDRFLTCTIGEVFVQFVILNPLFIVHRSKFFALRPIFVKKCSPHDVCPPDGIGATVKSAASHYTLRSGGPDRFSGNAHEFYLFSKKHFDHFKSVDKSGSEPECSVEVFYLEAAKIEQSRLRLVERWNKLPTAGPIKGMRQYHHFETFSIGEVDAGITSTSVNSTRFQMLSKSEKKTAKRIHDVRELAKNCYLIVEVLDKWYGRNRYRCSLCVKGN